VSDADSGGESAVPRLLGDEVHVLLVDDNEAWIASTAQILEHQREAFAVATATDLSSAAAAFAEDDPDCVVCDYQLEHGTGMDLLSDVRREAPNRPFILITGQGDETLASDAIGEQVTDYIPKRSLRGRDDLLARRIESAVDSYRTRRALARERRSKESMLDILRATSSRHGLVREFCAHLVRDQGYDCAWIGSTDSSGGVVPRAAAGDEGYLDGAIEPGTSPQEGTEPALVALARREPHVVSPIEADPAGEDAGKREWRTVAGEHGFTSAAAVPLVHEGTVLGVLGVYTAAAEVDAGEQSLLEEYGETIGYALRSAEWRESLLSATPVAVEVELSDEQVPLVAIERELPHVATIEVLTTVLQEDVLRYVTRIGGATPEEIRECTGGVETVENVAVDRQGEECRCELVVATPTPETVLSAHGGRILETAVENGRASVTATASEDGDIQSLITAVREVYPDAGVRSVRSSGARSRQATMGDLRRALTEKQREALELAFYSGYFERPREHNTTEVAEKLGVSRPTFSQHLRAGERKLLAQLLEK